MKFIYSDCVSRGILDIKLVDLMCKHVISTDSEIAKKVLEASKEIGYPYVQWGSHNGNTDVEHHLDLVKKQEDDGYFHPLRIVILKYDNISELKYYWADNLHSTIRYIRLLGKSVRLKDVPFYIIDLSGSDTLVCGRNNSLHDSIKDIEGAIDCAMNRLGWSYSRDLLDCNYRVSDFLKDNPILLEEVKL